METKYEKTFWDQGHTNTDGPFCFCGAFLPALYLTSSFDFDDAEDLRAAFADKIDRNIYSRFSNPNTQELVDNMCALEGAEYGVAFASGMAAVYTSISALLSIGDHIV